MKRFRACLLTASLAFIFGLTVDSFHPHTIAKNEVLELTRKLNKAYVENDRKFINDIHAENSLFERYRFPKIGNREEILEYRYFRLLYTKNIRTFFVFVEANENYASVSFWQFCTFNMGGEDIDYIGKEILTFEKQKSEWKITSVYVQGP